VDDNFGDGHSVIMGFWESFGSNFLAAALSGVLIAVTALLLARTVTEKYTSALADKRARHERNLAAAEELYRVYDRFFVAWKSWEYHSRTSSKRVSPAASADRRNQLISDAAAAEGMYEAFVVRMSLEQELSPEDRAAMCCLRTALKQLRYAIRDDQPLRWWRSKRSPEYEAFKKLMPRVAGILVDSEGLTSRPTSEARTSAIAEITGNAHAFLGLPQLSSANTSGPMPRTAGGQVPDWVVVADLACRSQARS
jgi:hypothetical protein